MLETTSISGHLPPNAQYTNDDTHTHASIRLCAEAMILLNLVQ